VNIGKVNPRRPTSKYNIREEKATSIIDRIEPTLRYSLRVTVKPPLRITSNHMSIAREPIGKKCGPILFPMILEKIRFVAAPGVKPIAETACLIETNPSKVIGQLFIKLANTVTIREGVRKPA
jgi:hypothetical protein